MRKLLLLLAVLVCFSLTGLAQAAGAGQTGTETTTKTTTQKKTTKTATGAAKESQLTGCLAKNAEGTGYMLTNGKYKKGVEVKSSEDLAAHVGHEVKLMGTWEKPAANEKGAMHIFNATSIKHISDTCKAGTTKHEGTTEKK
jgi:hypothetical protein